MSHEIGISDAFGTEPFTGVFPTALRERTARSQTATAKPLIDNRDGRFSRDWNRAHFPFTHDIACSGMFSLPELIGLARRRPANWEYAYWSKGPVKVGDRWEQGTDPSVSLVETLAGIADNNSFVMLRHVEQDEVFGPVICAILARLVELCGPVMRSDVICGHSEIIISSPRRVTSYHIDADSNFLFQIAGDKQLKVYPAGDPEVVTDEDLERYHSGDYNGAHYRDAVVHRAVAYDLGAGRGVHIPSTAPHSALSGDAISIGLSCAFDLHSIGKQALIYQFNRRLRRLGLHPQVPGASPWSDRFKLAAKRCAAWAGRQSPKHTGAAAAEWRPSAVASAPERVI